MAFAAGPSSSASRQTKRPRLTLTLPAASSTTDKGPLRDGGTPEGADARIRRQQQRPPQPHRIRKLGPRQPTLHPSSRRAAASSSSARSFHGLCCSRLLTFRAPATADSEPVLILGWQRALKPPESTEARGGVRVSAQFGTLCATSGRLPWRVPAACMHGRNDAHPSFGISNGNVSGRGCKPYGVAARRVRRRLLLNSRHKNAGNPGLTPAV